MLAAAVRSFQLLIISRLLVGAAGVAVLALAFGASALVHQPRVFTLSVPVAGGLMSAQGVISTVRLVRLPHRSGVRRLNPAWLIGGQTAAAIFVWLVLAWILWLRR
jgi:hypothetical protein